MKRCRHVKSFCRRLPSPNAKGRHPCVREQEDGGTVRGTRVRSYYAPKRLNCASKQLVFNRMRSRQRGPQRADTVLHAILDDDADGAAYARESDRDVPMFETPSSSFPLRPPSLRTITPNRRLAGYDVYGLKKQTRSKTRSLKSCHKDGNRGRIPHHKGKTNEKTPKSATRNYLQSKTKKKKKRAKPTTTIATTLKSADPVRRTNKKRTAQNGILALNIRSKKPQKGKHKTQKPS